MASNDVLMDTAYMAFVLGDNILSSRREEKTEFRFEGARIMGAWVLRTRANKTMMEIDGESGDTCTTVVSLSQDQPGEGW